MMISSSFIFSVCHPQTLMKSLQGQQSRQQEWRVGGRQRKSRENASSFFPLPLTNRWYNSSRKKVGGGWQTNGRILGEHSIVQYKYGYENEKKPEEKTICPALYSAPTVVGVITRVREHAVAGALLSSRIISTSTYCTHNVSEGCYSY